MFPELFRDDVFTLETARLFLRWPKAKDVGQLAEIIGEKVVSQETATFPHPFTLKHAEERVLKARGLNLSGKGLSLVLASRRDPQAAVGLVGVSGGLSEDPTELSLGYLLARSAWGQGLMTEAVQGLIDASFLYSEASAIGASVRVTNPASRRVLEHCGFQYAGSGMSARPAWGDSVSVDHYRLSRRLWASLKGWRAPLPTERPEFRESA
ncbi:MAG: GNAT family N-acetyltransferase [Methylobacterium sp.]|nr:GNAT family N-acetyltransferase [Methylobacterium sp.]MCA3604757.1 GNAT family N-acetyltransferase [Methylobacterium sp.]MCA3615521.1 GNAT family N-acetyltransferase [Methylobacterium sp.]MCA4910567.1 GNAT family N-acetyltransferase [Methylobacterium sp.]